ncbi:uncharacterized protein THITE_2123304 [Thermothielavioides terrestris NRRL 8126]|uniref:Uncharacterized protein n=2 Tax=Thermothielavioides terrestris TaxID=2587410 RepID=G2RH63_THETT|nr:uncharacterized protein THITE_2123304 [Thermothielavioides terrestris NRRL 8126]AEO71175.1 hypothetical protein THITE_2123304 [Thermothielavioides terrestris NRRL 8126]
MVKHFKRTHPGRAHAADMDIEAMSDSVSGGTPATPENNAAIPWRGNNEMPMVGHPSHQLHRAASFAEFGQPISNYGLQPQYNHRHSLSSSGAAEFHHGADPLNQPTLHPQQQQQQQQHQQQHHPGVPVLQRTASVPHHSYFVSDQNNPGVATMNATPHHPPQHVPYQHQVPRQGVEPLPLEIPSYPSAGALSGSIPNNSPGSFSAASGRSPSTQEGFYTHAPPGQTAGYTLHAPSPVDPQTPQMVNYHQAQLPPSQAAAAAAAAAAAQVAMTRAAPGQPLQQQQQQQQQQQPAHAQPGAPGQEQPWYAGVEYQPPVEVVTIGSVPPFSAGSTYDPWASVKLGFDDPSLQMPSERIASM